MSGSAGVTNPTKSRPTPSSTKPLLRKPDSRDCGRISNERHSSADAEVCIGAGNCIVTAAGVFDLDDNGSVVVRKASVTGEEAELAEAAADACPAFAIQVRRDA